MNHKLVPGQQSRVLESVDGFTRESLALKVGLRLGGEDAVEVVDEVTAEGVRAGAVGASSTEERRPDR